MSKLTINGWDAEQLFFGWFATLILAGATIFAIGMTVLFIHWVAQQLT
jgi:hypothetical protein